MCVCVCVSILDIFITIGKQFNLYRLRTIYGYLTPTICDTNYKQVLRNGRLLINQMAIYRRNS